MRIELTQAILMPSLKFCEKFDHSFLHVFIFGKMFPESRFRCYADYKLYQRYMFQFIPIYVKLVKGDEIVQPCDRHSNKTMTLRKHVTKYKHMRNRWSNFSENLRIVTLKFL